MDKNLTLFHLLIAQDEPREHDDQFPELTDEPDLEDVSGPGEDVIRFLLQYDLSFEVIRTRCSGPVSCFKN